MTMVCVQAFCVRAFSNVDEEDKDPNSAQRHLQAFFAECLEGSLNLPKGDDDIWSNYSVVIRDKSLRVPHSRLPVLCVKQHSTPTDKKRGRPRKAPAVVFVVVGNDNTTAKQAQKYKSQRDCARKMSKKKQRRLKTAEKKSSAVVFRHTAKELENAVHELNKAAEKFGAHVVYVDGVRKGKKAKSRITDKAAVLMHQLRQVGGVAAGKVAGCLDVVTSHLGREAFTEKWGSARTILRLELIMDQIELILLREQVPKALVTSVCWDLSPQSSKELLVTLLRVSWKVEDLPDIYKRDHQVSGTERVAVFNFALPIVQCATKDHEDVAKKITEQLQLVGLDPKKMSANGPILVTSDGGSENVPAMRKMFNTTANEDAFVHVYCACHGWNLAFTHACDTLPGRSAKKQHAHTKMTHW